ncbi:hypothetical protein AMECASPLE_022530 [Ameca splendens]|uniref:Uncharacterized protein n=1 Tax=Ameca splendens TaxID=208324 RepID=A0ABV0XGV9_9TELE
METAASSPATRDMSCKSIRKMTSSRPRPSGTIGHFVPQDSLLLQIPAGTAADRTGASSSDVTVDYVRAPETPTMAFHAGNRDAVSNWSITLEKKSHVDFHSFSPVGQREQNS